MTLPTTGAISFGQINTELGSSATAVRSLNDTLVRTLSGISSGAISLNDLRGKGFGIPYSIFWSNTDYFFNNVCQSALVWQTASSPNLTSVSGSTVAWEIAFDLIDTFRGIASDGSNCYVLGDYYDIDSVESIILLKIDSTGSIVWQKRYYVAGFSRALSYNCCVDSANNVLISIRLPALDDVASDGYIIKVSPEGVDLWASNIYFDTYRILVRPYGVAADSSGNTYACGEHDLNEAPDRDGWLIKWNSAGTLQWQKKLYTGVYNPSGYDGCRPMGVTVSPSGDVLVYGFFYDLAISDSRLFLAYFTPAGVLSWQRSLPEASSIGTSGNGGSVGFDTAGNLFVVSSIVADGSVHIAKYNSSGVVQWQRRLTNVDGGGVYPQSDLIAITSSGITFSCIFYDTSWNFTSARIILPVDGSHTGTWLVNGITLTYAADTLASPASSIQNLTGVLTISPITPTSEAYTSTASPVTPNPFTSMVI